MKQTIYYSFRTRNDLATNSSEIKYGLSHYSYKCAKNKFMDAFAQSDILPMEILRPEIYKQPVSFKFLPNWQKNKPHLIFKPFEEIRILKNAYNIGVMAWEFDKLSSYVGKKCLIQNFPLANQKRMISLLNELWVPSTYFKKVLENEGFKRVYFIPAQISINKKNLKKKDQKKDLKFFLSNKLIENVQCTICDVAPTISKSTEVITIKKYLQRFHKDMDNKKLYITLMNPGDIRKNFLNVLKTFTVFSNKCPKSILIIKLIINENDPPLCNVNFKLSEMLNFRESIKNINIIFVSKTFTKDNLEKFISLHDYYYCLSKGEGQNFPLQEAMALGIVPVSVDNTAMEDYISKENSYIIKSLKIIANENATTSGDSGFGFYEPDFNQAIKSLEESYLASTEDYNKKSDKARTIIEDKYSKEVILKMVKSRLRFIEKYNNVVI